MFNHLFLVYLGAGATGKTLSLKLYDTAGVQVGTTITSGFLEIGVGIYQWYGTLTTGFRGTLRVYEGATLLAAGAINPSDAESVQNILTVTQASAV